MRRQVQSWKNALGRVGVCLFGLFLLAGPVPGKELELKKKVGNLTVVAVIERDPPTVAKNAIEVRLADAAGNPLQDAKLLINYYMPPMARMPPMNFKVEAKWKKDAYKAVMDLIMAGPWIILVRITIDDKTVTAKFNIDAR
jgi:hypothetical protein